MYIYLNIVNHTARIRQLLLESSKGMDQESEHTSDTDDTTSIESNSEANVEQQTKQSTIDSYTQYLFIMNEVWDIHLVYIHICTCMVNCLIPLCYVHMHI